MNLFAGARNKFCEGGIAAAKVKHHIVLLKLNFVNDVICDCLEFIMLTPPRALLKQRIIERERPFAYKLIVNHRKTNFLRKYENEIQRFSFVFFVPFRFSKIILSPPFSSPRS